ncbi:penicillin acylase family protein [Flavisolibacter nicotianae]|uniref:penicillin acylase family protein n=1 Tax=Flavisolibacter nicotianae TaxID=2364882 RepID=UPI000EAEA721|nr:penicillin acylase family protein [Flavisolibacter nicotianae]
MRIVAFLISTVITGTLIFALNKRWGTVPALGRFLSPQCGFWQAGEASGEALDEDFQFAELKGKVSVYLDERLVPHVFADKDDDAYFVQGFLHAKYRLWQMDFQTRYAAGRLSEVLSDPRLVNVDRLQRRMGMVYAAEIMVKEMEKDPTTKAMLDAYTAGVNRYIQTVTEASLPFEFKLLGYKPEPWSNLKIALFIKLMSADLAGLSYAKDLQFTNMKSVFSLQDMDLLFPQISDSSKPIIPAGTAFAPPAVQPVPPANLDSLYYGNDTTVNPVQVPKPVDIKGSNNWAVSGSKTASGSPILCNDPHLRLSLPSIWYEMQIHTPTMNAYGATFPSIPGVVIGFNDNVAFGFTNAGRDVIDYYRIRFRDESRREYWYNGQWKACQMRVEEIKKRDGSTVTDTIAYTVFGPVLYDKTFTNGDSTITTALAMRWTAHDPSNEALTWYKLDRAKDYADYEEAIKFFSAPGQNMLFASKSGDIAIRQQGRFPLRWKGQGVYVMPGEDSTFNWQGWIPQEENPHVLNPAQGFLQSANQRPVDSTYPYFIPGDYFTPRGVSAYNHLDTMQRVTPQDMMKLQYDVYSSMAADAVPFLLKHVEENYLNSDELRYIRDLKNWDFRVTTTTRGATIYQAWFDSLEKVIWSDEFAQVKKTVAYPVEQTFFEILARDSAFHFIDNINTPQVETLNQQVTTAFKMAAEALAKEEAQNGLVWWKHKGSMIQHLLRDAVPALGRLNVEAPGWGNVLNAFGKTSGPSWRMIVHLTPETEAYGIYPAGQSGNPGSKFYDNFIDDWVAGKYYRLWVMKESEAADKRIIGKLTFTKA